MTSTPSKDCAVCGRRFEWRKKWSRDWEQIRYCSAACRRARLTERDYAHERLILALLRRRGRAKTICPSEVARASGSDASWRELMPAVRAAARRLVTQGKIEILQRGRVIDPSTAKGPIRLRLKL